MTYNKKVTANLDGGSTEGLTKAIFISLNEFKTPRDDGSIRLLVLWSWIFMIRVFDALEYYIEDSVFF